jgi:hypothetical protein
VPIASWLVRGRSLPAAPGLTTVGKRRLEEFARKIEALDPEAYAEVLERLQTLPPIDRLDARTLAAIILAMENDGHIDPDSLTRSE